LKKGIVILIVKPFYARGLVQYCERLGFNIQGGENDWIHPFQRKIEGEKGDRINSIQLMADLFKEDPLQVKRRGQCGQRFASVEVICEGDEAQPIFVDQILQVLEIQRLKKIVYKLSALHLYDCST